VQVEGEELVVSAFRRGSDSFRGLVVRCYNVTRQPTTARIRTFKPLAAADLLSMNEEVQETLSTRDNRELEIPVRGGQVVTVGLRFSR
jgi:alpha-mannosidase